LRLDPSTPQTVRVAGALTGLQGLAGIGFAVALLVRAFSDVATIGNLYGEAAYFAILGGAVLGCGIALVLGKRGVRGPTTVIEIILLGVAWYAAGPSDRPEYGIPVAALCVAVLYLLYNAPARLWAEDRQDDQTNSG